VAPCRCLASACRLQAGHLWVVLRALCHRCAVAKQTMLLALVLLFVQSWWWVERSGSEWCSRLVPVCPLAMTSLVHPKAHDYVCVRLASFSPASICIAPTLGSGRESLSCTVPACSQQPCIVVCVLQQRLLRSHCPVGMCQSLKRFQSNAHVCAFGSCV
jgi:hypothetical protein